jgi:hypothetical protein
VRASGKSWFVSKKRVGGFPEGDATSRWLIDIRTDLFPAMTIIIAAVIRTLQEEARAIHWPNSPA